MASRKLTLVFSLTILTILSLINSSANATQLQNHARMVVRKRASTPASSAAPAATSNATNNNSPLGVINIPGVTDPGTAGDTGNTGGTDAAGNAKGGTDPNAASSKTGAATGAAGQQSDGGILNTIVNSALNPITGTGTGTATGTGTTSSSSTTSTSSSSSTTSSSSSSSTTPASQTTPPASPTSQNPVVVQQTVDQTVSGQQSGQTQNANVDASNNSGAVTAPPKSNSHTTIIVIASVAGGIALIALIWTIFRKMKLGTSKEFDERLNPIDWQPHAEAGDGPDMIQNRRRMSGGSQRSFRSGDAHSNYSNQYGATGNNNNNMISDLPSHDFTAGPAGGRGLAPVGGYADLYRGPSPAPSDPYARVAAAARPAYGGGAYGGY